MDPKNLSNLAEDLYALLDIPEDATKSDVVKAYRRKALACHPDKNPNNPKAAEEFIKISTALEILTDESAKLSYDRLRQAKLKARERHRHLDAKRRKLKEELEAREKSISSKATDEDRAMQKFKDEVARLRAEGSALLKAEQAALLKKLREERQAAAAPQEGAPSSSQGYSLKLKLRWKKSEQGADYDLESLTNLFSKYGRIVGVVVSSKKKRSALIEFAKPAAAVLALEKERGYPENPLIVELLDPDNVAAPCSLRDKGNLKTAGGGPDPVPVFGDSPTNGASSADPSCHRQDPPATTPFAGYSSFPSTVDDAVIGNIRGSPASTRTERDFESLVLMKLRREEERRKLIEQIEKDDL